MQLPFGQLDDTGTVSEKIGMSAINTATLRPVTSKAFVVVPFTSKDMLDPIVAGYGVASTSLIVPELPAQSSKSILCLKVLTSDLS